MNPISLASILNGREYRNEITKAEAAEAKAAGLVVVFGASGGAEVWIDSDGKLFEGCGDRDCKHSQRARVRVQPTKIEAKWDKDGYSWAIETSIPHATFNIVEDGEKYCRGIVFVLSDALAMIE